MALAGGNAPGPRASVDPAACAALRAELAAARRLLAAWRAVLLDETPGSNQVTRSRPLFPLVIPTSNCHQKKIHGFLLYSQIALQLWSG